MLLADRDSIKFISLAITEVSLKTLESPRLPFYAKITLKSQCLISKYYICVLDFYYI